MKRFMSVRKEKAKQYAQLPFAIVPLILVINIHNIIYYFIKSMKLFVLIRNSDV